jgi:hypothetical protein
LSNIDIDSDRFDLLFLNPGGTPMERILRRTALVICILAIGAQASAEVVLLSQSRSVYAYDGFDETSDSLSAPDFGLFEESIILSWNQAYFFFATQNSEIQTGHFSIHGHTEGGLWDLQGYYADGQAHSDFEVLFEVTVPTPFSLIGTLFHWGGNNSYSTANSSLHLDWNGAPYLSFSSSDNQEEIVVSEHGILEPGAYTLTVNAMVMVEWEDYGASRFDFDFFLETPVAVEETTWGQVKALYR